MTVAAKRLQHGSVNSAVQVNDVHSKLNPTLVADHRKIASQADVLAAIEAAHRRHLPLAICGGGHAMGGQQFASDGILLDMNGMGRVLNFDSQSGLIEVEAGIQWPELISSYLDIQSGRRGQWGIRQKQTGADRLSIGGALAANIHGRVLNNRPLIEDIVSFTLIDANGELHNCSRAQNADLFRLTIGGYGLFGVVLTVTLQLVPRRKLERVVEILDLAELQDAFTSRVEEGYLYGDLQFRIDGKAPGFLQQGIFSCYRPVAVDTAIPADQVYMSEDGWQDLLYLAHTAKSAAFDRFAEFYLGTSGQLYWSDTHQLTTYLDDYHTQLDARLCNSRPGSEMITELYVPPAKLCEFMECAADVFRETGADLIYGTTRLIRRDDESFLAWARDDFACVIFNLHVEHSDGGIAASRLTFRRLIDVALSFGGSFFLTYHRHASRQQIERAYPQFEEFLNEKERRDPAGILASDWYRHHRRLFGKRNAR